MTRNRPISIQQSVKTSPYDAKSPRRKRSRGSRTPSPSNRPNRRFSYENSTNRTKATTSAWPISKTENAFEAKAQNYEVNEERGPPSKKYIFYDVARVILEGPKIGAPSGSFHSSETITAWTIVSGLSNQFRVEWILECQFPSSECRVAMDDGCRDVATHQSQLNSSATYAALRIRLVSSKFLTTCQTKVHIRARVDPSSAFAVSKASFQYRGM